MSLADAQTVGNADAKASAINALVERVAKSEDIDAVGFKAVSLDGVAIDLVVSSDCDAVIFGVYPEDSDYVALPRGKWKETTAANELSATKLDVLAVQREVVHDMEKDAEIHLAIIASAKTLSSMRSAWGEELQEKGIELVGYKDFESHLRKFLPLVPDAPEDSGIGQAEITLCVVA